MFGSTWFEQADPFEVFSSLLGRLSVLGRTAPEDDSPGRLVVRSPLGSLDGVPVRPSLVGVVAVLFGSTAFDSFKDSHQWLRFIQSSSVSRRGSTSGALLLFCLVVGVSFALATMLTGVEPGVSRRSLPDRFTPSVAAIVVGYLVAHYLSYSLRSARPRSSS